MASINVSIGVVYAYAAHAGNEVFVAFDGEVVHAAGGRRHFFDRLNGQCHEIAANHFESSIDRCSRRFQQLVNMGSTWMILPNRLQKPQIFPCADGNLPMDMLGFTRSPIDLTDDAIGLK